VSIEIDLVKIVEKCQSEYSDLLIDVEDIVDIDIYNRFEKYYKNKIYVESLKNDPLWPEQQSSL
jgi:hypothetical protein